MIPEVTRSVVSCSHFPLSKTLTLIILGDRSGHAAGKSRDSAKDDGVRRDRGEHTHEDWEMGVCCLPAPSTVAPSESGRNRVWSHANTTGFDWARK